VRAGVVITAMRYLELRDPNIKAIDEPHFIPASLLGRPEELELIIPELQVVSGQRLRKVSQRREPSSRSRATKELRSNKTLDEA
jgi:hypothetical protein